MSGDKSLVLVVWPLKWVMALRGLFHCGNSVINLPPETDMDTSSDSDSESAAHELPTCPGRGRRIVGSRQGRLYN